MMNKLFVYITSVIICSIFVDAYIQQEVYIIKDNATKINGKTITLISISSDKKAIIEVDGVKRIVSEDGFVNGVSITILDVFTNAASMNISMNFTCGGLGCEAYENSEICCTDCGCSEGKKCINNRCTFPYVDECSKNSDCIDDDPCTIGSCLNVPRRCFFLNISSCNNNDDCCPFGCSKDTDNDCVGECSFDSQCDDNNPCTSNSCINNSCSYVGSGCILNDTCFPLKFISNESYCYNNKWFVLKKDNNVCNENFECLSNNCVNKKCKTIKLKEEGINFFKSKDLMYYLIAIASIVIIVELVILKKLKK